MSLLPKIKRCVTAHHTVTVSSPSRWLCGLASALPLLLPASTLLLCWLFFFFSFFLGFYFPLLLSTSPGFLGSHSSSPLCSGMASGINQSIILVSLSLISSPSLGGERWGEGGWFCVLSQDKQFFVCVSKGVWLWLFLFKTFYVQLNDRDRLAVVFFFWGAAVVVITLPTLHKLR